MEHEGTQAEEWIVLAPGAKGRRYLRDLWAYRELFMVLARRDIALRYKQAVFGVGWALVRPLATALIFTFAFGQVARLPSDGVPYPLFVLAGTLPWQLFATALSDGGLSVVNNSHIVSKTYFPRLIVPASSLMVALLDFAVALAILLGMMLWYGVLPSARLVYAPLFVLLTLIVGMGAASWIAALNVRYRDMRHLIPFMVQLGLFVSPVGYGTSSVPTFLRGVYRCNPMVAPIDGLRWCLFGTAPQDFLHSVLVSALVGVVLLVSGYAYFRRTETSFADVI